MPCSIVSHRGLVGVSTGCPRATGMSLTRYAPFRRSPPGRCRPALPLDLHVLSLPLAFILSQDQTLHCIISYKSQFEPWLFLILCGTPDEESLGIDALVLIVFFGTCSCTPSELPDSRRLFGTRKFLPLSLFNELLIFCIFLASASSGFIRQSVITKR